MTDLTKVRLIIPDHIMMRELDGEAVLLNVDTETYFGLDEVGTRMWRLLADTGSFTDTRAALLEEFEVEASVLDQDLNRIIGEMVNRGLLVVDEG